MVRGEYLSLAQTPSPSHPMLDHKRFGPPDFSGKVVIYPVQWCASMPIGSLASRREMKLRRMCKRVMEVIGRLWAYEITIDWDTHLHHDELGAYMAHWGDERAGLAENSTRVIDLADMSDRMRELLVEFDPAWKDDREFCDSSRKRRRIVNPRTDEEKLAARQEKEALLLELDAFDAEIKAQ